MDDKLIRLLIGWSLPFLISLIFFFILYHSIRDLIALLRSRNESFKPVECVVVDYGTYDEDIRGYYLNVKRLDGVVSKDLVPYNYFVNSQEKIVKKYIGCHMTFYAKDSAPGLLFCKKDITSQEIVEEQIKNNIGGIIFFLLFLPLFIFYFWYVYNEIY